MSQSRVNCLYNYVADSELYLPYVKWRVILCSWHRRFKRSRFICCQIIWIICIIKSALSHVLNHICLDPDGVFIAESRTKCSVRKYVYKFAYSPFVSPEDASCTMSKNETSVSLGCFQLLECGVLLTQSQSRLSTLRQASLSSYETVTSNITVIQG